jgi:hypothetical protein
MSALGHKRTSRHFRFMSALAPIADIKCRSAQAACRWRRIGAADLSDLSQERTSGECCRNCPQSGHTLAQLMSSLCHKRNFRHDWPTDRFSNLNY